MSADRWDGYLAGDRQQRATTNQVAGCPLPYDVENVIEGTAGAPSLFTGRGPKGQRWLVAQVGKSAKARRWLCAPASDLAIRCVLSGRAQPADLFRHSVTGAVEDITVGADGRWFESIRLCDELSDSEVPSERVLSQAL
jgi:hypothetical protein